MYSNEKIILIHIVATFFTIVIRLTFRIVVPLPQQNRGCDNTGTSLASVRSTVLAWAHSISRRPCKSPTLCIRLPDVLIHLHMHIQNFKNFDGQKNSKTTIQDNYKKYIQSYKIERQPYISPTLCIRLPDALIYLHIHILNLFMKLCSNIIHHKFTPAYIFELCTWFNIISNL